jgi:cellulose synthase/poly-beta-1,6-N-acetylglucosamine synthase-like glycosyltransferase
VAAVFAIIVVTQMMCVSSSVSLVMVLALMLPSLDLSSLALMYIKALRVRSHTAAKPAINRVRGPRISVIMPSFEEPFDVKSMTLDSVLGMGYPGELEFISVDNSRNITDPDWTRWRMLLASPDITRRADTMFLHNRYAEGLKPGNLDHALGYATGEYIVFVDVDSSLPADPTLLLAAVGRFEADPGLGFVQFRVVPTNSHFNRLTDGFARYQRAHHLTDMVGGLGGFVLFKGHNAIWRRSVLDVVGPWQGRLHGRLVLAEDFLKAVDAYAAGYRGEVSPIPTGEWVPNSVSAFVSMWRRWEYGTFQVLAARSDSYRRATGLTVVERFEYLRRVRFGLHGMPYLVAVVAVLAPDPVLVVYLAAQSLIAALGVFVGSRPDSAGYRSASRIGGPIAALMSGFLVYWVAFTATVRFIADALRWRLALDREPFRLPWVVTSKGIDAGNRIGIPINGFRMLYLCNGFLSLGSLWLLARSSANFAAVACRLYGAVFFLSVVALPAVFGNLGRPPPRTIRTARRWTVNSRRRPRWLPETRHEHPDGHRDSLLQSRGLSVPPRQAAGVPRHVRQARPRRTRVPRRRGP